MDGICLASVYVSKVKGWGQTFPLMWDLQWNVWLGDSTGWSFRKKKGQFDYFGAVGFNRTYRIGTLLSSFEEFSDNFRTRVNFLPM